MHYNELFRSQSLNLKFIRDHSFKNVFICWKNNLLNINHVCVYLCVYGEWSASAHGGQGGSLICWSWNYRWFWDAWHGFSSPLIHPSNLWGRSSETGKLAGYMWCTANFNNKVIYHYLFGSTMLACYREQQNVTFLTFSLLWIIEDLKKSIQHSLMCKNIQLC